MSYFVGLALELLLSAVYNAWQLYSGDGRNEEFGSVIGQTRNH